MPGRAKQRLQQREFPRRQPACLVIYGRLVRRRVEMHDAVAQDGRGAAALPSQNGAHPCQQFAGIERLDQIIIGAQIEPADPVIDRGRGPIR